MTFVSLSVTDDGDNGNGDWSLQFDVNGYTSAYAFADDVIDDTVNVAYPINRSVDVPLNAFTPALVIRISGTERDGGANGSDDPLTTAERTYTRAEGFGIGRADDVPASPSSGDAIGGYSVRVRIECLAVTASVVSLTTLYQAAAWRLERENHKRRRLGMPELAKDDSALLGRSLAYLRRRGWALKSIHGDHFIFEGVGDRIDLRTSDPRLRSDKRAKS